MRWPNAWIAGTGINLPEAVSLRHLASQHQLSARDVTKSQIHSVTIAEPDATGAELAIPAAQMAVANPAIAGAHASAYMHAAPHWLDQASFLNQVLEVGEALHIPQTALPGNNVSMCDGLNAVTWLLPWLSVAPHAPVLATSGGTWSIGVERFEPMPALAFGDAGAAMALTASRYDSIARILSTGTFSEPRLLGMHRPVARSKTGPETWPIRFRERSDAYAKREGISDTERFDLIGNGVSQAVRGALVDADVRPDEIKHVSGSFLSPHLFQLEFAGPLVSAFGFSHEVFSYAVELGLGIGHTGPSDPFIFFHRLLPQVSPGDTILLISSAAGYTWTAMVIRIVGRSR